MIDWLLPLLTFWMVFFALLGHFYRRQEQADALRGRIAVVSEEQVMRKAGDRLGRMKFLTYGVDVARQIGMNLSSKKWFLVLLGSSFAGYVAGQTAGLDTIGVILCLAGGFVGPFLYMRYRKQKHLDDFSRALLEWTEYGKQVFQYTADVDVLLLEIIGRSPNKLLVKECKEVLRIANRMRVSPMEVLYRRAVESGIEAYFRLVLMTQKAIEKNASLYALYKDMNEQIGSHLKTEASVQAETLWARRIGFFVGALPLLVFILKWSSLEPMLVGGLRTGFYVVFAFVLVGLYSLTQVVRIRV